MWPKYSIWRFAPTESTKPTFEREVPSFAFFRGGGVPSFEGEVCLLSSWRSEDLKLALATNYCGSCGVRYLRVHARMEGINEETRRFVLEKMEHKTATGFPYRLIYPEGTLIGSQVYLTGTATPQCLCLDAETLEWKVLKVENWSGAALSPCLVEDSIMSIMVETAENLVVLHDLVLNSCTRRPVVFPHGVLAGGFTADYIEFKRQLAVFGGILAVEQRSSSVLAIVDADTLDVIVPKVSGSPPSARNGHASCARNCANEATVFVYGGRTNGRHYYHDLFLLHCEFDTFRWSRARENNAPGSSYSSLTYVAGKVFLFGGFNRNCDDLKDFRIYEVASKSWHNVDNTGKYGIIGDVNKTSAHTAVNCSKGLFFIGGFGDRRFPWTYILRPES